MPILARTRGDGSGSRMRALPKAHINATHVKAWHNAFGTSELRARAHDNGYLPLFGKFKSDTYIDGMVMTIKATHNINSIRI